MCLTGFIRLFNDSRWRSDTENQIRNDQRDKCGIKGFDDEIDERPKFLNRNETHDAGRKARDEADRPEPRVPYSPLMDNALAQPKVLYQHQQDNAKRYACKIHAAYNRPPLDKHPGYPQNRGSVI